MKSFAGERLEETLGYWQDNCWFMEAFIVARASERKLLNAPELIAPQLHNWKKFEQTVFDNTTHMLKDSEWGSSRRMREEFWAFGSMYRFPFEFFEWSRKSRRAFHLPSGLWQVFVEATYPEIRWSDVLLPFESFIITLDGGIQINMDDGGLSFIYDTILVARTGVGSGVSIRLIRAPLAPKENRRLSEDVKHRFETLHKRGDQKKTLAFLEKKYQEWNDAIIYPPALESVVFFKDKVDSKSRVALEPSDIVDGLEAYEQAGFPSREEAEEVCAALSDAAKIVVGWCLYLRTLTASSMSWKSLERRKIKRGTRGVTGIITQPEHLCTILGEARLDPVAYGLSEPRSQNSGFFKRPHWRRAHFARPRGSAPTAVKSVEVPPLLIRKDLVPLFGIIGGTKTEVLPDE